MNNLKQAYTNLFKSIEGSKWEEGFCKPIKNADYTTFTAMRGNKYFDSKDREGNDFRFMLVGRAVNGWDEYRRCSEETMTRDIFVESSMLNLCNDKETLVFGNDRFEWIDTRSSIPLGTCFYGPFLLQ